MEYSYPRYLTAKGTVDDRSLNVRVWDAFRQALHQTSSRPLRLLEVGGGIGAMVQRIVPVLPSCAVHYTLLDVSVENIGMARNQLPSWAEGTGYHVTEVAADALVLERGEQRVTLHLVVDDVFAFAQRHGAGVADRRWDGLVAHAFLDLFPLRKVIGRLLALLRRGGLLYLPIHFDGLTCFAPVLEPDLDAAIMQLYHTSMVGADADRGGHHTGRLLWDVLREEGVDILEAGGSDWVVFARNSRYAGDEAYFLHHMLQFIEKELSEHPALEAERLQAWLATRRQQIEEGSLVLMVHQLDFLGQVSAPQ